MREDIKTKFCPDCKKKMKLRVEPNGNEIRYCEECGNIYLVSGNIERLLVWHGEDLGRIEQLKKR